MENFAQPKGVFVEYPKQSSGLGDLGWDALVEECLCFGWIDSVPAKVDEIWTTTYIAPRRSGSGWSARNKQIVSRLANSGLLRESGLRVIERAQSDGSWERFDLAEALVLPAELVIELESNLAAKKGFESYPVRVRKSILQWLYDAKQTKTLHSRIEKLLEAAARGERLSGF
jgi:uncharacterized protein YdeI (YjbR/CyaY-like superfamily)